MRTHTIAFASLVALTLGWGLAGCGPKYPKCNNDQDCHKGEYCVNGMCQQCRTNADCPTGNECVGGRCEAITGFCQSDSDCPKGQKCRDNQCQEPVQSTTELPQPEQQQACTIEPVYFNFDSSDLETSARNQIQSDVECMHQKNISSVHLTGYTDPRGTEEYNLALGDRRARSVKDYMKSLGFSANDVSVSSVGEEYATGTDEASWAKDRKVEFQTK